MSAIDAVRGHVAEHRRGMLFDLVFATVWVSTTSLFVDLVGGPQWAASLLMAAGVVAYFGFVWSLSGARDQTD